MKYKIPCTWTVCGDLEIEADNLEAAILEAEDAPLPVTSEFIDGSFEVNHDMIDFYKETGMLEKQ
jgi:hypothetical protein